MRAATVAHASLKLSTTERENAMKKKDRYGFGAAKPKTLRRLSKSELASLCHTPFERGIGLDTMVQELARGISAHGRSRSYKRRGIHFLKKKNNGEFPKHDKKQKTEEAPSKAPKFYPAGAYQQHCHTLTQLLWLWHTT